MIFMTKQSTLWALALTSVSCAGLVTVWRWWRTKQTSTDSAVIWTFALLVAGSAAAMADATVAMGVFATRLLGVAGNALRYLGK